VGLAPSQSIMVVTGEIVEGLFSPQGKITDRALTHLRHKVAVGDEDLHKIKNKKAKPAKKPAVEPPQYDDSAPSLLNSTLRSPMGNKLAASMSVPESEFSRSMKERWLNSDSSSQMKVSLDDAVLGRVPARVPLGRTKTETYGFTTQNKDATEVFCDSTRYLHRRYVAPSRDIKTNWDQYNPKMKSVWTRAPDVDIAERAKHLPIRPKEVDTGMELGETWSSFGNPFSRSSGLEQMKLATDRPDIVEHPMNKVNMTPAPDHYKEWGKMDEHSTIIPRRPDWDFKKHTQGHKAEFGTGGFDSEPGKYDVNWQSVERTSKSRSFEKGLKRAEHSDGFGYTAAKAVLRPSTSNIKPDRSSFRGCAQVVGRKTGIQDFGKDLDRPPLIQMKQVLYDEDDPEISAQVWRQEMSFDASTVDKAVIPRHDHAPCMSACPSREKALKGKKIAQMDLGLHLSTGGLSQTSVDASSIEATSPSCSRTNIGMSFDQMKGRYEKAKMGSRTHSALGQPKESTPFEFSRTAPAGFMRVTRVENPEISVQPMQGGPRKRMHQALHTWAIDGIDEDEDKPLPSAPPLRTAVTELLEFQQTQQQERERMMEEVPF